MFAVKPQSVNEIERGSVKLRNKLAALLHGAVLARRIFPDASARSRTGDPALRFF